jgi:hypothetical protein
MGSSLKRIEHYILCHNYPNPAPFHIRSCKNFNARRTLKVFEFGRRLRPHDCDPDFRYC